SNDKPGDWRDIRIPRPARLMRMTVVARTIKDGLCLRTHLQTRLDSLCWINCRISPGGTNKLNHHNRAGQNNKYPAKNFRTFLHSLCSPSLYRYTRKVIPSKERAQRAPREADFFAPSIHCMSG